MSEQDDKIVLVDPVCDPVSTPTVTPPPQEPPREDPASPEGVRWGAAPPVSPAWSPVVPLEPHVVIPPSTPVDVTPPVPSTPQPDFKKILGDGPDAVAIANIGQLMKMENVQEIGSPKQVGDIRPQSPAELGPR